MFSLFLFLSSSISIKKKKNFSYAFCAGILRNSTIATQRDGLRHSAPVTTLRTGAVASGNFHTHPYPQLHHPHHHHNHLNATYHQRCSLKTSLANDEIGHMENTHELSALSSNGQNHALAIGNNMKSNQRNSVRWCSPKATGCTATSASNTETTSLESSVTDKNYLANRTAMIS